MTDRDDERDCPECGSPLCDHVWVSVSLIAEVERLRAQRQAVLDRCDEEDASSHRLWDMMDDYAPVGYPKEPWPDNACMPVKAVRALLGENPDL